MTIFWVCVAWCAVAALIGLLWARLPGLDE
jgi:hypothetical protein